MRKLLNKPWFVVLLAIVALGAVWHTLAPYFRTPRPTVEAAAEPVPQTTAEESSSAPADAGISTPMIAEVLKQVLPTKVSRNPFASTSTSSSTQASAQADAAQAEPDIVETVHLSALWTQKGATLAFINDHVHQAGDVIGRLKVDSVGPHGVWLSHAKGQTFLEVGKSYSLHTPARLAAKSSTP